MSIKTDRVSAFYDAVRALTYNEMLEVSDEVSAYIPEGEIVTGAVVAKGLSDAADGKPTNAQPTRSSP